MGERKMMCGRLSLGTRGVKQGRCVPWRGWRAEEEDGEAVVRLRSWSAPDDTGAAARPGEAGRSGSGGADVADGEAKGEARTLMAERRGPLRVMLGRMERGRRVAEVQ